MVYIGTLKPAVNPYDPYADALGRLLINCGALEVSAKAWLQEFGEHQEFYKISSRITRIIKCIDDRIDDPQYKSNARVIWAKVADLMQNRRNAIAHSPWVEEVGVREGIYDKKEGRIIQLTTLNNWVDESCTLANELFKVRLDLRSHLPPSQPPVVNDSD